MDKPNAPESDMHDRVSALLPWYVTGRLDGDDRALVEAHLPHCEICRADLKFERRIDQQVAALPADPDQSWAAFAQNLQSAPSNSMLLRRGRWHWLGTWQPLLIGGVIAAQAVALLVITGPRLANPQPAGYQTMTSPGVSQANAVIMLRPQTTVEQMRAALVAGKARIADGPTSTGTWLIRIDAANRAQALAAIRQSEGVALAEPIQ